jgi:hypothetical protein
MCRHNGWVLLDKWKHRYNVLEMVSCGYLRGVWIISLEATYLGRFWQIIGYECRSWIPHYVCILGLHALWMEELSCCLARWFGDREGKKSIILEAILNGGLHIWHAFFGLPGSKNDLNVLDCFPLVHNMLTNAACDMHYVVNGCEYDRCYLFIGGIYLEWSYFVQSIHLP